MKFMKRDLRRKADGHHGRTGADRGVPCHVSVCHAPAPKDLGKAESSVMGMPPGRQICPPCVCPLNSRSNPECAACRYISGVWDKRIENSSCGTASAAFSILSTLKKWAS